MVDAANIDAIAYYRTVFPDLESLGDGTPPSKWWKEFQKVAPEAFDATLGTHVALEGSYYTSLLNFRQSYKIRALHARRSELDSAYANPYETPVKDPMKPVRAGFQVRMGLDYYRGR